MYPKRTAAAEQAREIVRIIEQGQYESPAGTVVRVPDQIERARAGTRRASCPATRLAMGARAGMTIGK
jgi:hypothetical protein